MQILKAIRTNVFRKFLLKTLRIKKNNKTIRKTTFTNLVTSKRAFENKKKIDHSTFDLKTL